MLTAKEIIVSRVSKNIDFPIIIFFFLTIGNYSFFRYSIYGSESVSPLLKLLPFLRLLIPVWIVLYCLCFNLKFTSKIIKDNFDIISLGLSWLVSCVLSLNTSSYLLYGLWSLFSVCAILLFVCYISFISETRWVFLKNILNTLWIGNFIIIILDVISMLLTKPRGGMYHLLFSSNTFWAYPTMIMGMLAVVKMRFTADHFLKKLYYGSVFLISLVAIYFSARRSPLFALLLTTALFYIPLRLPRLLLIIAIIISSYTFLNLSTRKDIIETLPDSYMKYRIERMYGFVKGRKETSYSERQKIWKIYLDRFYAKPVMGEGLSTMQQITKQDKSKIEGLSAHNTFIGLLAETGIMGALLIFVVLGRSFLIIMRTRNADWIRFYIILFIPTLIINWVEYNLIPGQIFFLYTFIIWFLPRGLFYINE